MSGPVSRPAPGAEAKVDPREGLATPWRVIVHDDPVNLMSYVTMVLQKVFGYPRELAERLMLEVHTRGRSIVWTGELERAEGYLRELHGYHLLATIERAT